MFQNLFFPVLCLKLNDIVTCITKPRNMIVMLSLGLYRLYETWTIQTPDDCRFPRIYFYIEYHYNSFNYLLINLMPIDVQTIALIISQLT